MYNQFTKYLSLMLFLAGISIVAKAEIKSPNYDFNLAVIESFFPGKGIEEAKKDKAIKSDIFEDNGNIKIWRFKVNKKSYMLDIYAQVKNDKITDMYVRLPQHFSHDQVLADLQKRYKKQDKYVNKDMSSLYVWVNRDGNNVIYHGSCSITCFPMFVEVVSTDKTVTPLYQKLNEALPKW